MPPRYSQSAPGTCFFTSSMCSSIERISHHTRARARKRPGGRWKRCARWLWRRPHGSLGAGLYSRSRSGALGRPRSHASGRPLLHERIAHSQFLRSQREIGDAACAVEVVRAMTRPVPPADALLPLAPRRCTTSSSASSPIVCCSVAV